MSLRNTCARRGALATLRAKGLVETSVHKVRGVATTFYKINWSDLRGKVFEVEECNGTAIPPKQRKRPLNKKDKRVIPEMDKIVIPEKTIGETPYKRTNRQFLNYSSEVIDSVSLYSGITLEEVTKKVDNVHIDLQINSKGYPANWDMNAQSNSDGSGI